MKNLVKKNQLMITALAIMIAIAGYLQFAGTNLEEDYLLDRTDPVVDVAEMDGVIAENYTSGDNGPGASMESYEDPVSEAADLLSEENAEEFNIIDSLDADITVPVENYLDRGMQTELTGELAQGAPEEGETPGEALFASSNGVAVLSEAKLIKEQTRARNKETLMDIISSDGLTDVQKQEAVDSMVRMTEIAEKESAAEILLEAKGFSDVVVSVNGNAVDVVVNALELSDAQRAQIEDIVRRKVEVAPENIIISTVVD